MAVSPSTSTTHTHNGVLTVLAVAYGVALEDFVSSARDRCGVILEELCR